MKKVYQTKFGKEGNCFSACLASILEIDIEKAPTFRGPKGEWYIKYKRWLNQFGLDLVAISNWDDFPEGRPKVYAMVGGTSPRGLKHSVIYFDGDMVHDPHPEGGGVKDITDWIYLVPKFPNIQSKTIEDVVMDEGKLLK